MNTLIERETTMTSKAIDTLRFPTTAVKDLVRAIDEARTKASLHPHELGDLAGIADHGKLENIENAQFTFDEVMSLTAVLGVPHDRVLPLVALSPEQKSYWTAKMEGAEAGPLASSDGNLDLDPDLSLELFIRFEALREIFPA